MARSGGPAPLADDAASLAFGGTTPDPVLLPSRQRVFEAGRPDRTLCTDRLGRFCVRLFVARRIEDVGIESSARGLLPPGLAHGGVLGGVGVGSGRQRSGPGA